MICDNDSSEPFVETSPSVHAALSNRLHSFVLREFLFFVFMSPIRKEHFIPGSGNTPFPQVRCVRERVTEPGLIRHISHDFPTRPDLNFNLSPTNDASLVKPIHYLACHTQCK
ncbi:hypothetical protein JTE90_019264 [Oedothorax gibbosus]|uniref:Uncharacterized protein n=1 Tax=Oedothorax gibbosus TaxID=931172 RepID=A0AAV6USG9_9ARAC|nr:hypothetical protein JTE90_019264 [Oedothorax gibbosus]